MILKFRKKFVKFLKFTIKILQKNFCELWKPTFSCNKDTFYPHKHIPRQKVLPNSSKIFEVIDCRKKKVLWKSKIPFQFSQFFWALKLAKLNYIDSTFVKDLAEYGLKHYLSPPSICDFFLPFFYNLWSLKIHPWTSFEFHKLMRFFEKNLRKSKDKTVLKIFLWLEWKIIRFG